MPLQATSGAASYDGFGGGVPFTPTYIEDVFSTWLYTGTGSTQTITNGIDLAGKGGLVWIKCRGASRENQLFDTARGANNYLTSNGTGAQNYVGTTTDALTAFNSDGFSLGVDTFLGSVNSSAGLAQVSWTFRKQPKFFDVVTYTGNGSNRTIAHNLGSVPGCIIVKRTDADAAWLVYHRSTSALNGLFLNGDNAAVMNSVYWNNTDPTSTVFTVGTSSLVNTNGGTYVAYLFAHDAGGFGLTGTDNVISCGSFTTDGSGNATVSLGYEPQWALIKPSNSTGDWVLVDTMRSWVVAGNNDALLYANTSDAEVTGNNFGNPTATGFTVGGLTFSNTSYIYIAIRRGPMKTPTTGTSVYENTAYTGNGASNRQIGSSVLTDLLMLNNRDATAQSWSTYAQMFFDRLRGDNVSLATANTNAESGGWNSYIDFDMNAGWDTGPTTQQTYLNNTSSTFVSHAFRRAPGFFDVVCYTGTGSARTVNHNLGVVPEMMIVKRRTASEFGWWAVYHSFGGGSVVLQLNTTSGAFGSSSAWNSTDPTASVFSVGTADATNASNQTYVAYLFASCPGVSKIGTYTGTGALQTINCGFTGGARFVLIKRWGGTGDWWVYDSARGITSGNDPYLFLNSTAAEVTGTNYVDTTSVGFQVTAAAPAGLNNNGDTYIYLAIA